MVQIKPMLVLATVGIVSLAALGGCSQPKQAAEPSQSMANSPTAESTTSGNNFRPLKDVIANTRSAVEADDFTKAQTEFANFEAAWSKVEDGVKMKSSTTYDAIEKDADAVNSGLKKSQPNQEALLQTLTALRKNVAAAAQ